MFSGIVFPVMKIEKIQWFSEEWIVTREMCPGGVQSALDYEQVASVSMHICRSLD
jgi:hypothetical protein